MADAYCSDCKKSAEVVFDRSAGDKVCSVCELVLESHSIDEISEWCTFANGSGDNDTVLVGGPSNPLLTDGGLSTVISKPIGATGATGDFLSPSPGLWQNRGSDPDRSLIQAFKTIATMCDRLGLVATIKDRANEIFKEVEDQKSSRGRNQDALLAACLYIACQMEDMPCTGKEICSVANGATKKEIGQAKEYIMKQSGLEASQSVEMGAIHAGDFMVEDWTSVGSSDSEYQLQDLNDEDHFYASGHIPKLQFRKDISRACWNEEMRMAEVLENKGQMWRTTGVVRNGKIYCSLEETLFLAEIGALLLSDDTGSSLSLREIYEKVAEGRSGCSWESVQVYRHLKSLGYIVRRHGEPWTIKRREPNSISAEGAPVTIATRDNESEDRIWIAGLFNNLNIKEVNLIFDVYLPSSKFRKSSPGNPSFVICLTRDHPPSKAEIEALERQCNDIPIKFCSIEHGRVSFFSFNSVELPTLP